jgi:hypothetical protein
MVEIVITIATVLAFGIILLSLYLANLVLNRWLYIKLIKSNRVNHFDEVDEEAKVFCFVPIIGTFILFVLIMMDEW